MEFCRRVLSVVAMLAALCSFLPPAGWAICVDATGHLAIEPAPQGESSCCASTDAAPVEDSCSADACPSCEDIALSADAALRAKSNTVAGSFVSPQATATLPVALLPAPLPVFLATRYYFRSASVPPRTLNTILRC